MKCNSPCPLLSCDEIQIASLVDVHLMAHQGALFCRTEINRRGHSYTKLTEALLNIESCWFILTLNQKYWRAAIRLFHLIFCTLFGSRSLF